MQLLLDQKAFFAEGHTLDYRMRMQQLKLLNEAISKHELALCDALEEDFGKAAYETYTTELALVQKDIRYCIKHLKRWSGKQRVSTNIINWPGRSYRLAHPLGCSLILGAWNYPYLLCLGPLVSALSAGCTAVIKPSELAPKAAQAMADLIHDCFPSNQVAGVQGDASVAADLCHQAFDKIFFTGSTAVGQKVYQAAAQHLTPVTLEMGGKSPAIIHRSANLTASVERIVWGKYLNAGQTCIAPDYVLLPIELLDAFVRTYVQKVEAINYSTDKEYYCRIVNDRHFERLTSILEQSTILHGGQQDPSRRFIAPSLLKVNSPSDAAMQEELFGPLLPILTYDKESEIDRVIHSHPNPLAFYVFSRDSQFTQNLLRKHNFGGATINDSVVHIANPALPFGGVGQSGIGSYHGKAGFDAFSHYKRILHKPFWGEIPLKYPPYGKWQKKVLRWLMGI